MNQIIKQIYDYSLEDILGERFGRYSKSIIQDRALPDVRDGLKPVHRRILYSMYRNKNTHDKAYQKSARAVGDVMGKYHPHGDLSIYEAMVRMSQWWKQTTTFVDMHGNNGSIDGDSAAAMRYTEARLSEIALEMLKDIDKNTILWAPNYDDTLNEPTVLPARFPNLLINGSSGISSGYATSIPPHNLGEVIDATIKRINIPNCHLESLLKIIKGPDFPTGGIVYGAEGIENAFATGRGKIIHQAKYEIVEKKKKQIIIHEIPFEVNKTNLVKKIDEICIDKKIEGIAEVRDESDLNSLMRIVIDLKKEANVELIINYLLKNTDMQVAYNYNMVAIVNKRPKLVNLMQMLDAYIAHQREVIVNRSKFDLSFAEKQMHIVEGLIKAIAILDEIILIIRKSENKNNAKENLINEFDFTEKQADAIVTLQLYRLTNTDVVALQEEKQNLEKIIKGLKAILADEETLKSVMKEELKRIKNKYKVPRKSLVEAEIVELKVDAQALIPEEEVVVTLSKEGYLKRVSKRSYQAKQEATALKKGDYLLLEEVTSTLDTLLIFTNLGHYLHLPIHQIAEYKWGELGKHISSLFNLDQNEKIVNAILVNDFSEEKDILILTAKGMVKRTKLLDFQATRYSKPILAIKLKKQDEVVFVSDSNNDKLMVATKNGFGLSYFKNEIPIIGLRTAGVKAISLKNDLVVSGALYQDEEYLLVVTNKKTAKRIKCGDLKIGTRARKGSRIIRDVATNPYYVMAILPLFSKDEIGLQQEENVKVIKSSEIPILDNLSTGRNISKEKIKNVFFMKKQITI